MERFGPHGNFPVEVVQLQGWSYLTGRSGPTKTCRVPFPKIFVSSPTLLGIIKITVEKQMDASIRTSRASGSGGWGDAHKNVTYRIGKRTGVNLDNSTC